MNAPAESLGEGSGRGKQKHSNPSGLFPESSPTASTAPVAAKFEGTDNPRYLRAIHALLTRSQKREHLDHAAGCSNGPDLVADLRRRGLDVPCERIPAFDRDGKEVRVGVYSLTTADRRKLNSWMTRRQRGFIQPHLLGLLAVAAPSVVALVTIAARWLS